MSRVKNKVLIMSSPDDPHASTVAESLNRLDVEADYWRYNDFSGDAKLDSRIGSSDQRFFLTTGGRTLSPNDYSSIWHRRPGLLKTKDFVEPWIGSMVRIETEYALVGLFKGTRALWVNNPANDQVCVHKLWQLELAQRIGFKIPDTIVTNDPEVVRAFYKECSGKVIYKMISELSGFSIPSDESPSGIPTLQLRESDLPYLDQVVHCPHIFQRMVQKSYELRVTVVGQKVFPIKIESSLGKGTLDWRNDYSVPMSLVELPPLVERFCLELTSKLGLNYGAIDLIVDSDSQYVFLEINCAGQFKWIENRVDVSITDEMANLLAGLSPALTNDHL